MSSENAPNTAPIHSERAPTLLQVFSKKLLKIDQFSLVWLIARRDISAIRRSRALWMPSLLLPMIMSVLLPAFFLVLIVLMPNPIDNLSVKQLADDVGGLFPEFSALLNNPQTTNDDISVFLVNIALRQLVTPLFLLIPTILAATFAADAFAGERERGSLEALLYTPTTDTELFWGKILSAWIPSVIIELISFAAFTITVDTLAYIFFGHMPIPTPLWLIIAFWLSPAFALNTIFLLVVVSAKAKRAQEATQIGALVVVPVLLLLASQLSGLFLLDANFAFGAGFFFWTTGIVAVKSASSYFSREKLFTLL